MSRYAFLLIPLLLLPLVACQPDSATTDGSANVAPVTEPTALPPVVEQSTAVPTNAPPTSPPATETFIPVIEADATPAPEPTVEATPTPAPSPTPTTPLDSLSLVPVLPGGLDRPLYLTHAGDARLFVVEQPGLIRVVENGQLLPPPFIDLRDRVGSVGNEQGLLSVAFHPDYAEEGATGFGSFFVNYTDYSGDTQIERFTVSADDPNVADRSSGVVIMSVPQPYTNHNGGLLKFGPDGYLYVGVGDGGSANDPLNAGQNPNDILGTLLRLDVSAGTRYAVPADNPFASGEGGAPEIWAWGLRNPWRFSFDRLTGDLFIADVGQNLWEEVNFEPAGSNGGLNYGWAVMEASTCFNSPNCDQTGLVLPFFEYDHSQGCSVTGGYVYRGQAFPEMNGNYFVADYCVGTIWRSYPDGSGGWDTRQLLDTDLVITSFGEDVNGELYVLDRISGAVYQLVPGA